MGALALATKRERAALSVLQAANGIQRMHLQHAAGHFYRRKY
jgi:hypothetical protein